MKLRILGKSGITVSALGLGCMTMSPGLYHQPDQTQAVKTLHRAIDLGINFFERRICTAMVITKNLLAKY